MIFIALLIVATIIIILGRLGFIKNPVIVFMTAILIIGAVALIFNNRIHCPFAKKCPFHFCPLHK